jgi:hypothetical protein
MIKLDVDNPIISLDILVTLGVPAIYGVEDLESRAIWIGKTSNLLKTLGILVTDLKEDNHPCSGKNVKIVVLDIKNVTAIRQEVIRKKYLDMGYSILNRRTPISYRVVVGFTSMTNEMKVSVSLVNRRNEKTLVGVFDKNEEAKRFIEEFYSNGVEEVIYSSNSLTEEYLKSTRKR